MKIDSIGLGSLGRLPFIRENTRRGRESSWDETGGNDDRFHLDPGEKAELAALEGPGSVTHIWMTLDCTEKHYLRKAVLRMFWEGEENPSVEVPVGDFFGLGHALSKNFSSLPLTMSPKDGKGFNCYFPMPFMEDARIELENDCEHSELLLYYYVDYELYDDSVGFSRSPGRFHATWNRENPTEGTVEKNSTSTEAFQGTGNQMDRDLNRSADENYLILEAKGKGHYVGCNLNVNNLRVAEGDNWYGEGDDMIFIDGEEWPPSLHGTGTEDYFNTAWCPKEEYQSPYHGIILGGGEDWSGPVTLYRFHIEDPIYFDESIKVTIEHGHANNRWDDYSSTAYWYQLEPHEKFSELPEAEERVP